MLRLRLAEVQLAFMMLTRLPTGQIDGEIPPNSATAWAFPLVGALIGALAGFIFWAAGTIGLPPLAAALLAIATSTLLTGALHEDGLADTADGFGGGRDKARKLQIMRDSHLGSYGAVALFLVLGLTASGISEAGTIALFVAIGAASRTAMLLPMMLMSPAREDGLGASASAPLNNCLWIAVALTVVFCLSALTLWPLLIALLAALTMMALAQRHIGGQTGDVLGATQKVAECAAWLAASCAV